MSHVLGSGSYDRFDALAEEFAARYRRGERPSLQEYIDRLPEMADEIRELFPTLVEVERAEVDIRQPAASAPQLLSPPVSQVGDYRVLREVGRGGMGVVYEAEQISLGRRVALKVLPSQVAGDPRVLERFRREAKAAACLHHTNIVPVFEVGRDGEIAFYAMQFIQGQGLDQVIDELARRDVVNAHPRTASVARSGGSGRRRAAVTAVAADQKTGSRSPWLGQVAESLLTGCLVPELRESAASVAGEEARPESSEPADPDRTIPPGAPATVGGAVLARPESAGSSSAVLPGGAQVSSIERSGRRQPYFRSVAQIGRQAAQGLAYAHARGIVHRDIKPSNLLLDTAGVVWITDFGLAKAEDDGLTATGDILGTLRYMAPECFRAEGGLRADIYALGLTLYELLTLRPAFDASDKLRLIERVKSEEPTRPRLLDGSIPRDLETVVLKAIDKDPAGRYASADAMAEDLRRFLDDEPIAARRATAAERYFRWARRNPAIAVLGGVLTAVLLAISVGSTIVAGRMATLAEDQRRTAEEARLAAEREHDSRVLAERRRREAEEARQLAEANFGKARTAVDDYLTKVTDSQLLTAPGLQSLRSELLGSALRFYDEFLEERGNDPAIRAAQADVLLRVASVHEERSDAAAAEAARNEALRLYDTLAQEEPDNLVYRERMLEALRRSSQVAPRIELAESILARDPLRTRTRELLADLLNAEAIELTHTGDLPGSFAALDRSLRLHAELLRAAPDDPDRRRGMSVVINNVGAELGRLGRRSDSLTLYRRGYAHVRTALARSPHSFHDGRICLHLLGNIGRMESTLGLGEAALRTNQDAVELARALAAGNPDVPLYVSQHFRFATLRGDLFYAQGRYREAIEAYREALAATQASGFAKEPDWLSAANVAARLASVQAMQAAQADATATDDPRERSIEELHATAVRYLRRALARGEAVDPASLRASRILDTLHDREDFQDLLAELDARGKDPPVERNGSAALADVAGAPTVGFALPPVAAVDPELQIRGDLAAAAHGLGNAYLGLRLWGEAGAQLAQALEEREALVRDQPDASRPRLELAQTILALGDLALERGRLAESLESRLRGRDMLLSLSSRVDDDPGIREESAALLSLLGNQLANLHLLEEAAPAWRGAYEQGFLREPFDLMQSGVGALLKGDPAAYRSDCRRGFDRFQLATDSWQAADIAVLCVLAEDSGIDPVSVVELAERGVADSEDHNRYWRLGYRALVQLRAGRPREAIADLEEAHRTRKWDEHRAFRNAVRALAHWELEQRDQARESLAQARHEASILLLRDLNRTAAAPGGFPIVTQMSLVLLREATTRIQPSQLEPPRWSELFQAWVETQAGRVEAARASLARVGVAGERDPLVRAARAHMLAALGEIAPAQADLDVALRLDPEDPIGLYVRGRFRLEADQPLQAAEDLVRVLAQLPDDPEVHSVRSPIDALIASSDLAFERAIALRPDDWQLWVARGRFLAWHGRWREATDAYPRGIGPAGIFHHWLEYACVLVLADDVSGYQALCRKVLDLSSVPEGRDSWWGPWAATSLMAEIVTLGPDSGLSDDELRGLLAEVRELPTSTWSLYSCAHLLTRLGEHELAAQAASRSIDLDPRWRIERHWFLLARTALQLGQPDAARRWFDRAERVLADNRRDRSATDYPPPGEFPSDELVGRVLRREVQAALHDAD